MNAPSRTTVDLAAYRQQCQTAPCFVCGIIDAQPEHREHEVFYDDGDTIAFFNKYQTLLGYSLVCPKRHAEDLTEDLTETEYLAVQAVVRKVSRALKQLVPTERVYVMSLGSMTGNAHIHWHVAPLPPGVPYEKQQYHALMMETAGVLDVEPDEVKAMAARMRELLDLDGG